ncbi:MAG TPA: hypothetical protein VK608_00120, partial [Edaphobacter sp.]|nr:hypothetical protein [Edaphobacter sp.]
MRHMEGTVHGFLALRSKDGRVLAVGDLFQVVRGVAVVVQEGFHCFVGSGFLGAFRIHLQLAMNTRRSPGWVSATMRKISSRVSLLTHFRPARALCRERHVQYSLKPARCQATTVSGWTMTSARFHPGQNRRNT